MTLPKCPNFKMDCKCLLVFLLCLCTWFKMQKAEDLETKEARKEMLFCKYIFKILKKTKKKFPDPFVTKG